MKTYQVSDVFDDQDHADVCFFVNNVNYLFLLFL